MKKSSDFQEVSFFCKKKADTLRGNAGFLRDMSKIFNPYRISYCSMQQFLLMFSHCFAAFAQPYPIQFSSPKGSYFFCSSANPRSAEVGKLNGKLLYFHSYQIQLTCQKISWFMNEVNVRFIRKLSCYELKRNL